jgi:class 3 adenylate cyclase
LSNQYEVLTAYNGEEALKKVQEEPPDIVLSDVIMPEIDGYELCQRLKKNEETKFIPVVLVTSLKEKEERIKGLEVGADDFLTKPVDSSELLARVRSLLRIKHLHDELAKVNETLEQRVKAQVEQIQRLNSMKRYISPQIVEGLISEGTIIGQVKRKNLTVFFSDIRDFTKMTDVMEPEELLEMLNKYFSEMTEIVFKYGGTLDKFMGDGIMGFIGDPCEYSDHAQRAVKMAMEMQSKVEALNKEWLSYIPSPLQIGIGINTGYVTVGNIGSESHMDYTAIGRNVNLAARLQEEAKPGQILISQRTWSLIRDIVEAEKLGEIEAKGFDRPVTVYSIYGVSDLK